MVLLRRQVKEWLVSVLMEVCKSAQTVRTADRDSEMGHSGAVDVKVWLHQGSALSPLLSVILWR